MNHKTEQSLNQGYEVKIGDYITRGFEVFKTNIGGYLGYFVLYLIITSILGVIPFINLLASLLVSPCLVFGFYLVSNHIAINGSEPPFGDYFNGFNHFSKVVVVSLLVGLAVLVCFIPAIISFIMEGVLTSLEDPEDFLELFKGGSLGLFIIGLLGAIYLGVSWIFASQVAVFQNIDALKAMEVSRKVVSKNWFGVFAFLIVIGVITMAGAFLFLIGLLFTVPLAYCCVYAAYEDIFGSEFGHEHIIDVDEDISSIGGELT